MRLRKLLLLAGVPVLFLLTGILGKAFAQENADSAGGKSGEESSAGTSSGTDWKKEIASDGQELKEQYQNIAENANAARQEEEQARDQIHQAIQSGDYETAKNLRDQLKETHRENIEQKHSDIQALKESRQEFRNDLQGVRQEKGLPPVGNEGGASGFNPPGVGPGNPPGRGLPPEFKDRAENRFDRREDFRDKREDVRDHREDVRDRREDIRDRREDVWDSAHNPPPGTAAYRRDKLEDVRDRREDIRDRREDVRDRREDFRDKREDFRDRKENFRDSAYEHQDRGVQDHGAGIGAGRGQGGEHRADALRPRGNGPAPSGGEVHRGGGGPAHASGGEHRGGGGPMHAGGGHGGGHGGGARR